MANETSEEQVSALVDGELFDSDLRRALDSLKDDPTLTERWTRYHLISDALRNNLADRSSFDIHRRVREALESEPAVLAPKRRGGSLPPLFRQAAGLAVAASVTAVAILGVQSINRNEPVDADRMAAHGPAENQSPSVRQSSSGQMVAERPAENQPSSGKRDVPGGNRGLDAYVLNHNEFSASTGMQGALPYVRIVSDGTAR